MDIFDNRVLFYAYILFSFAVSVVTSVFLYRKANLKGYYKAVLTALRSLSLFLILILLANPFFDFLSKDTSQPKNLVLVDNSESISLGNKRDEILRNLTGLNSGNSEIYTFGSRLLGKAGKDLVFSDSSMQGKYCTNLSAAIEDFINSDNTRTASVIVYSDGMINSGMNLIRTAKVLNAPFYYYLAGDTAQKNDVSIIAVDYNREVYAESVSDVNVKIFSHGYNSVLKVNLFEEDVPVQSSEVKLSSDEEYYSVKFQITSQNRGIKKYRISAEPQENEFTLINNSEEFCIRFTDNNFRLLVIAGSPGYDFSLLKQTLAGTKNFTAEYYVLKSPDSFYEGELPAFSPYDAVIFMGFPSVSAGEGLTDNVLNGISAYSNPLLFIGSSNTGYGKLKKFEKFLPVTVNTVSGSRFQSSLKINENRPYSGKFGKFSISPPLFFMPGSFSAKPDAEVIASTVRENFPAVVIRNTAEHRSAVLAGWNYTAWNLNPSDKSKDYFQSLVSSLLSVLIEGNRKDALRIYTDKSYYAAGEPVNIEIKNDLSEKDAEIQAMIISGGNSIPLEVTRRDGAYVSVYIPQTEGDYRITVSAVKDGKSLLTAEGRFIAGKPVEEFRFTKSDNSVLSRLAAETGGYRIQSPGEMKNVDIKGNSVHIDENRFLLRNSYLYLIILIFLLSLEWYIRKRINLS